MATCAQLRKRRRLPNPTPSGGLLGPAANHAREVLRKMTEEEAIALQAAVRQQRRTTEPGGGLAVDRTAGVCTYFRSGFVEG
jgi:hypothetical protein